MSNFTSKTQTHPQDVHDVISEICEYVTLYGKWDFADVIKLIILRWGNYAGLSGWSQCNHKHSYKREEGELEAEGTVTRK